MNLKTPGEIERFFRKELGAINPYMCLIDSAVKEFKNKPLSEINSLNKNSGHPNIYLEHLELNKLQELVNMSHIAYINSKAETACNSIMNLKEMNKNHKNVNVGDYLRKTIFVVHRSKYNLEELKSKEKFDFDEKLGNKLEEFLGKEEFHVIDYYRKIRNSSFHNSNRSIFLRDDYFNETLLTSIENKFGYRPNNNKTLNENDIYILSLAWQNAISSICKSCIDIHHSIIPNLQKRYSHVPQKRRLNGIRQSLQQEYLLTKNEVDDIIHRIKFD
ncbi:hypothetical protein [Sulfurimonas microaerophilic]|uniref:hypothetical protein n=1 Tax=Sulfurimonas microaerophilic TaxID=3058392 RepID=UPI0027148065|nr:hypothetical protein [Sulfurimonas sp. hsl 1-7]